MQTFGLVNSNKLFGVLTCFILFTTTNSTEKLQQESKGNDSQVDRVRNICTSVICVVSPDFISLVNVRIIFST